MTPEILALARRAAKSRNWSWQKGMRVLNPSDVVGGFSIHRMVIPPYGFRTVHECCEGCLFKDSIPDLTDPATIGSIEHGLLAPLGIWLERSRVSMVEPLMFQVVRGIDNVIDHPLSSLSLALVLALECEPCAI